MSANQRVLLDGPAVRRAVFPSFEVGKSETRPLLLPAAVAPSPAPPNGATKEVAEQAALRERIRVEAFEVGLREGRAVAYAEWTGRLQRVVQSLDGAAQALLARRVEVAAEVDRRLPGILFLLARKILHRELAAADTTARSVLRSLTEHLSGLASPVAVRVDPQAAELFETWRRTRPDDVPLGPGVRIDPDPSLAPGDWVLETRDGFLDGRVESRLEAAWHLLTELPQ